MYKTYLETAKRAAIKAGYYLKNNHNIRIDENYEQDIRLWDIAAAMAIVKAAGGKVCLKIKKEDYKCDFGAFATKELMEEFYGI